MSGDVVRGRAVERREPTDDAEGDHEVGRTERLLQHLPGYDKVLHGEYALCEVPMATLAERCPHFGAWLGHLEAVAASATE